MRNVDYIELPVLLGAKKEVFEENDVFKIEYAMQDDLKQKIKILFYRDPKNSNVSEHEFELRFFELKRYFLMCSILRDVPMFSDEVDEVWHTLILSTRDYQRVCDDFMGTFLHHAPATSKAPNPHGRAWFDLIYTTMFDLTAFTGMTWGGFYQHPLSHAQIEEIQESSVLELRQKYFRPGANERIVEAVILQLKKQVEIAFKKGSSTKRNPFTPEVKIPQFEQAPFFAQAMIYYSYTQTERYGGKMVGVQIGFNDKTTSSSACGVGSVDIESCGSD